MINPHHKPSGHYDNSSRRETSLDDLPLLKETNTMKKRQQHQKMVRALVKNSEEIQYSLTPNKCHLLHMGIGIGDEYFELKTAKTKENQLEELGDMLFYAEGSLLNIETDIIRPIRPMPLELAMKDYFECIKRHVFYEQELNTDMFINAIYCIIDGIHYEASRIAKNLDEVRDHNLNKLAKRYENYNYSNQRAKDRVDKDGTPEEEK